MQQGVCLDPRVLQAQLGQRRPLKHQAFFKFFFFLLNAHTTNKAGVTLCCKNRLTAAETYI